MSYTRLQAILCIPCSILIICVSILFYIRQRTTTSGIKKVASYVVFYAIFLVGIAVFAVGANAIKKELWSTESESNYEDVQCKIDSGYTVYINGIKADAEHITIEQYSWDTISTYDDKKEIQIAANR